MLVTSLAGGSLALGCGGSKSDEVFAAGVGGSTPTGAITTVDLEVSGQGTVRIQGDPAEQPVACDPSTTPCHAALHGLVTLTAKAMEGSVFVDYVDPPTGSVFGDQPTYTLKAGTTTNLTALFVPVGAAQDGGSAGCPNEVCPTTLASKLPSAAALALGEADVFFLGSIEKVSKSGGAPSTLFGAAVSAFALDASGLYFLDGSGTALERTDLDGKNTKSLGLADGRQHTQAIAVDDANVYWLTQSVDEHCTGVMRMFKDASSPAAKVAEACDQGNTVAPSGLALDGTSVYWTSVVTPSFTQGTVWRAPKGGVGAAGEQIHLGSSSASRPLMRGTTLYWMQDGVMKIDLPDCSPLCTATHAAKTQGVSGFAVDSASIYSVGDGGLVRADKATLGETRLANEAGQSIVVDNGAIYWAGGSPGAVSIYKIAK